MVIRRISPLSVAKIAGLLYAVIGLVIGAVFSLIAMAGAAMGMGGAEGPPFVGLLFGVGAIIALPIFYGVLGAVVTGLMAVLYNVLAGIVGGIRVEVDQA